MITPARPPIFKIKDVIKPVKKKKLGQLRCQVAVRSIAIGDDHGLRIRSGDKIRKPGFGLISGQVNRPTNVAGSIINRMARIDKNRFVGLIQVKGLVDRNIGNLLVFHCQRLLIGVLDPDRLSNLIGPDPIHDKAEDTGNHKDDDGLFNRLFKHLWCL